MCPPKNKSREKEKGAFQRLLLLFGSLCARYFTGTQATGAGVDMLGRTIHHDLHAADIGLPGSVGTSVRMGLTNTKNHRFAADFTLCHVCTSFKRAFQNCNRVILSEVRKKSNPFLPVLSIFFWICPFFRKIFRNGFGKKGICMKERGRKREENMDKRKTLGSVSCLLGADVL